MVVDICIKNSEILLEVIKYLDKEDTNGYFLENRIPLLIFFTKKIIENEGISEECDAWLDKLAFEFCMRYLERCNSGRNSSSHQSCHDLLLLASKRRHISVKLLKRCIQLVHIHKNNLGGDGDSNDAQSTKLSLEFAIHLIQEVFSSLGKIIFDEELVVLQEEVFSLCIQLIRCGFVADSCFVMICGLLNDLINPPKEKEVEIAWSTISHLYDEGNCKRLMIMLSILLQALSNSNIIRKNKFWMILQEGLVFPDPLTRKRALYIIKWLLDHVSKENNFSTDSCDADVSIISWSKNKEDDLWSTWKTVILLLETLEEKQMHVINPVLPLINEVFTASMQTDPLLHSSWTLVILRRALNHESKLLNKWSLRHCLQMNLEKDLVLSKHGLKFIFVDLIQSLQSVYVYGREEHTPWGSPPIILELLITFISNCLKHLDSERQCQFINMVLDSLLSSSFNDISLVYFTETLSHQTISASLSTVEITSFKNFLVSKISIYRIEYQKAVFQNLSLFYTNNMLPEKSIISSVIQLLSYAVDNGFLVLNGNCWNIWLDWLKGMPDSCKEDCIISVIQEFLLQSLTSMKSDHLINTTGFSILVIMECVICPQRDIRTTLKCITDIIVKLHSNPYLDHQKVLKVLEFINALLKASLQFDYSIVLDLVKLLISSSSNILEYLIYISEHLHESYQHFEILEQCLCLIQHYITASTFGDYDNVISPVLTRFFNKLFNIILSNLNSMLCAFKDAKSKDTYHIVINKLFSIKLLKYYLSWHNADIGYSSELFILLVSLITKCDRQMLYNVCKESEMVYYASCDVFVSYLWCCLTLLCERNKAILKDVEDNDMLLETFFSDITIVSYENILDVIKFGKYLIPMFAGDEYQLTRIIEYMWKVVKEQAQTDHSFWKIYKSCIDTIFHDELLISKNDTIIKKLKEIWTLILEEGEKKLDVVNILLTRCIEIWNQQEDPTASLLNFTNELIATSIFGPLFKKCGKPMDDLIYYLHNIGKYDKIEELKSVHYANVSVRATVVNFLLNLQDISNLCNFINPLKLALLDHTLKLSESRKCYYPNTLIHRKILRTLQLFLVLLSKHASTFDYKLILPKLYKSVKTAHQTSIRYFIEWCILLIFCRQSQPDETLWDEMEKGSEKQILSVTSILSLSVHLAGLLNDVHFETFVQLAVPKILPWAHAQHMTSRLHAQVALETIWNNILKSGNKFLQDEFNFLSYCFTLKVDNSPVVKHRAELMESFFYSRFHPLSHYSLETIYYKFPMQVDVMPDEWITVDKFAYEEKITDSVFKIKLHDDLVLPCKVETNQIEDLTNHIDEKLVDLQKKIMPWRILPSADDIILQSELDKKKESKISQLILCAVLVDKIPNIGGLCRTAEIFGVHSLIIGSHRYVEDKGFKSLSVSAERWVNIEQVLPIKLALYLKDMRSKGYQIVGVEQTANSKTIGKYIFPEKTVLVLGNEKTGIPVDLIQLLDECVEIPQLGIIRSLNVHISGAIMIWEYCKQHMLDIS